MTNLSFAVEAVAPEPFAIAPILTARVRVSEADGAVVHALALRCQVRIEPQRRGYTDGEASGLADLFGPRERWQSTLRPFLWLHCGTVAQGFTGSAVVELPMLCTYDFEVSASKYLHALEDPAPCAEATVPLTFLFSGTVFTRGATGFAVEQVPWDRESRYDLPVAEWRELTRAHFPGTGWMRLTRENLEDLARYKAAHGFVSMDEAVSELMRRAGEAVA